MKTLKITHILPDLLNLYGDKGNMKTLVCRAAMRDLDVSVAEVLEKDPIDLSDTDILFLGGGTDTEQEKALKKLQASQNEIAAYVKNGGVLLATCGGFEMLGNTLELNGNPVCGLKILNITAIKQEPRLLGDICCVYEADGLSHPVVGFENHGARIDIGDEKPLLKVLSGKGNTGDSGFEGVRKQNVFATSLHGPLLPKNPELADEILACAFEKKYGEKANFCKVDDSIEHIARETIKKRLLKT